jgi:hypothetical protein
LAEHELPDPVPQDWICLQLNAVPVPVALEPRDEQPLVAALVTRRLDAQFARDQEKDTLREPGNHTAAVRRRAEELVDQRLDPKGPHPRPEWKKRLLFRRSEHEPKVGVGLRGKVTGGRVFVHRPDALVRKHRSQSGKTAESAEAISVLYQRDTTIGLLWGKFRQSQLKSPVGHQKPNQMK